MKKAGKLVSMLAATALTIGAFASAAGAEGNIKMLDPRKGDMYVNSNNVKDYQYEDTAHKAGIKGRTITSDAAVSIKPFTFRTPYTTSSGTFMGSNPSQYWKNNFTWEFDFKLTELPDIGAGKSFYIYIGSEPNTGTEWKSTLKFISAKEGTYRLSWAGTDGSADAAKKQSISSPTIAELDQEPYVLKLNETYHLKIEADLSDTGKVYVTFKNPNCLIEGKPYTKTTERTMPVSQVYSSKADVTDNNKYANIMMRCDSKITMELTNEEFYMDRFRATAPELTLNGGQMTVNETVISTNPVTYWVKPPMLVGAVYDSTGKMVRSGIKDTQINSMTGFKAYDYSTVLYKLDSLQNGTYTVKAFVWNTADKMVAYPNCLVEKTLTVTNGTVTMAD